MTAMTPRRRGAIATGVAALVLGTWAMVALSTPEAQRVVVGPGAAPALSSSAPQLAPSTDTLLGIATTCATAAAGSDGPVELLVTSPIVITDQSGTIDVPCTLKLQQDGAITLRSVTLETENFGIVSDEGSVGTRVRLEESTLRGSAGTSLVIFTRDGQGTVSVEGSTIDYPNGVVLTVSGTPSTLELQSALIRSQGENTEGISISARDLRLGDVRLEASREPFVFAETCTGHDVAGARPRCKSVG